MTLDGDTIGDSNNCLCPHCGKNNHYVTQGIKVSQGKIVCFSKKCTHCGKDIFYRAEYVVKVTASTENPINRLIE